MSKNKGLLKGEINLSNNVFTPHHSRYILIFLEWYVTICHCQSQEIPVQAPTYVQSQLSNAICKEYLFVKQIPKRIAASPLLLPLPP